MVADENSSSTGRRGNIINISENEYAYDYYDCSEPDSSYEYLAAKGYQGGGPSWHGIIHGLLVLHSPDTISKLRFDPEGSGIRIWSAEKDALITVANLVTKAKKDQSLLEQAIEIAVSDDEME